MIQKYIGLILLLVLSNRSYSQQVNTSWDSAGKMQVSLYQQVARADSLLFDAFNRCDSVTYKTFFTRDLEFYHDQGGLTVGLDKEMQSFTDMCRRGTHLRRELIKSMLEVHPIKGYGAVEIGVHRFYHTNPGQPEKLSGTYKFVHVWQLKDGWWKLARVISYGHDDVHNE